MHGTAGRAGEDGGPPSRGRGRPGLVPAGTQGSCRWMAGVAGAGSGAGLGSSRRGGRGGETGGTGGERGRVRFSHGGEGPREQRGPVVGKRLGGQGERERERRGGPG